jgi:hypothetical protein
VLQAAERARTHSAPGDGAVAAPARDAGSCYFPDLSDAAHGSAPAGTRR